MRLLATHEEPGLETGSRVLISSLVSGLMTFIGVVIGGMQTSTQRPRRVQSPEHRPGGLAMLASPRTGQRASSARPTALSPVHTGGGNWR